MKTIHKYMVEVFDEVTVSMPENALILGVKPMGAGHIDIYAMVYTEAPMVDRLFAIRGTGHPLNPDTNLPSLHMGDYIGTAYGAPFVWHVFAR